MTHHGDVVGRGACPGGVRPGHVGGVAGGDAEGAAGAAREEGHEPAGGSCAAGDATPRWSPAALAIGLRTRVTGRSGGGRLSRNRALVDDWVTRELLEHFSDEVLADDRAAAREALPRAQRACNEVRWRIEDAAARAPGGPLGRAGVLPVPRRPAPATGGADLGTWPRRAPASRPPPRAAQPAGSGTSGAPSSDAAGSVNGSPRSCSSPVPPGRRYRDGQIDIVYTATAAGLTAG